MTDRRRPVRVGLWLLLATAIAIAALTHGDRLNEPPPRASADELLLRARIASVRGLLADRGDGPLVPFEQGLVVVHQRVVLSLLEAALPWEFELDERFTIQLESASVSFDDGLALVRLEGKASLSGSLRGVAFAQVSLDASLNVVEVDPATGTLRSRLRLIAFEARRLELLGRDAPGEDAVEELGRKQLTSLEPKFAALAIPVRIEQHLRIPGIGPGVIVVPPQSLPISAEVRAVTALRGKLIISLAMRLSSATALPPGPT